MLRELLGLVAQGLHAVLHVGDLAVQLGLAGGLVVQKRPGGGHMLAQSLHAGLFTVPVRLHAVQLVLKRRLHGAQPRPLGAHVAQAVHGLYDLLLGVLGARLQIRQLRLRIRQRLLPLGKRSGRSLDDLRLKGDGSGHLVDLTADALAALGGGGALGREPVALLLAGGDALPHHLHRALAGLHLADEPLHGLALLAGLQLQRVQPGLGGVALRALLLKGLVGLEDGLAQALHAGLQFPDAGLVALGAHEEHVEVEDLQLVPELEVLPRGLGLLFERGDPLLQLGEYVLDAV